MKALFEHFNYQGLMELIEEKYGNKFAMDNSDLLYLWFCVQRKLLPESRAKMIQFLRENRIIENNRDILDTVDRYFKFKEQLPELNPLQHARLDRAQQYLNPIVPFQQIGDKMLGITESKNKDSYSVIDISEAKENVVAVISKNGGIRWADPNLHSFQMKWIIEQNEKGLNNKKEFIV